MKYKKIMRYSVQPKDRIFGKGYGFLSFAKNMVKILVIILVKTWVVNKTFRLYQTIHYIFI